MYIICYKPQIKNTTACISPYQVWNIINRTNTWLNAANIWFQYFTFIYSVQNKIILLHFSSSCISWVPDYNSSIMTVGIQEIFHKDPPSEKSYQEGYEKCRYEDVFWWSVYFTHLAWNTSNSNTDFAGNAATSGDLQMAVNFIHLLWLWYEWCFAIMNQPIFLLFILVGPHSFRTNNNLIHRATHSTLLVSLRKQYLFVIERK